MSKYKINLRFLVTNMKKTHQN